MWVYYTFDERSTCVVKATRVSRCSARLEPAQEGQQDTLGVPEIDRISILFQRTFSPR